MPGEPGETGMMESAVLGWVSQGLQHEVIVMASCCKKGGGQKGNNCHRQTCSGTTGITVLRRDSGVVAGADLRRCLPLVNRFFRSSPERHGKPPTLNQRISLRIHHNGKSTAWFYHYIRRFIWCSQCSYLLCPRLFRGVTPYRHDGESLSCMQGMACTFRLPAGPCTKEPPDRYRRMCHTPDAFTPGSALRHLSNDKATNGMEWGALSCCVYQKGNNLSSKGQ